MKQNKKPTGISKNTILWICTIFFITMVLGGFPHISSFIAIPITILIAPIRAIKNWTEKNIKKTMRTILLTALIAVWAISMAFTDTPNANIDNTQISGTTQSVSSTMLTTPTETNSAKPDSTETQPTESKPTKPESTDPEPTEPEPTEPEPTEPEPTEPDPTEPEPTEPDPTEPDPTKPEPTEPEPTEPEPTEPEPTEPEPTEPSKQDKHYYVLNTSTKKFHYDGCWSANRIDEENLDYFYGTREELIAMGYSPCGHCDP